MNSMINSTLFARLAENRFSSPSLSSAMMPNSYRCGKSIKRFISLNIAQSNPHHIYRQRSIKPSRLSPMTSAKDSFRNTAKCMKILPLKRWYPQPYALKQSMSNDDFSDVVHSNAHNILAQIATSLQFLSTSREYLESKRTKSISTIFKSSPHERSYTGCR